MAMMRWRLKKESKEGEGTWPVTCWRELHDGAMKMKKHHHGGALEPCYRWTAPVAVLYFITRIFIRFQVSFI